MRDLAAEAGVSFATPFNQFGTKGSIMHALSERRIDIMIERFTAISAPTSPMERVLLAVDTAVAVMLEEPVVNRAVMGWIGTASSAPGKALERSTALWAMALAIDACVKVYGDSTSLILPEQLALAFRGALSFWTAGELPDDALRPKARAMAITLLLGFTEPQSDADR